MNLGIGNAQSATWKRIKTQHIAAAASVGLAVAAAVGGLTLRDSTSSTSPSPVSPASITRPAPQPETFLYVVGSQAEAIELQDSFATAALESGVDIQRYIFVADSPEAEAALQVMQAELMQAGPGAATVADLRFGGPVQGIGSPADYSQVVTPEAEALSTGVNPSGQTAPVSRPVEYVEFLTPEAEMLSAGMTLP